MDIEKLASVLERGPVPANQAVKIVRAILSQLVPVHAKGRFLGCLSPANVGVHQSSAEVRVLLPPVDGAVVSTSPHYASPERIRGEEQRAPTDIYAAGVLLFHMLSGIPPFDGDSADSILEQHTKRAPPSLAQSELQEVPGELEALVQHMLQKDPSGRPSAAQVIDRIDNLELDSTIMGVRLEQIRDLAKASVEEHKAEVGARPSIQPASASDPFADTFIRNRADFDLELPTTKPDESEVTGIGPDGSADGFAATQLSVPKVELPRLPPGPVRVPSNLSAQAVPSGEGNDTQILAEEDLKATDKPMPAPPARSDRIGKLVFVFGVAALLVALGIAVVALR